jgi:ABC-type branched-subunit amino acid transport system ATPase component/sugar phosphate permease
MSTTTPPDQDDPAALAAAVLEEEARRQEEQQSRAATPTTVEESRLPGVGGEQLGIREVVARGGLSTVTVLCLLNMVDEFDRVAFQILGPDIQRALGLSDTMLAAMAGLTGVLFAVGVVPLGYLADRMRRTWIVTACSAVFTLAMAVTGLIRNVWQLAGTRVLVGFGKANTLPVHNAILADAYPIEGRGKVFSAHSMSRPLGLFFGPLLVGAIAGAVSGPDAWRWPFIILAIPAAVLTLASLLLPEPQRGRNELLAVLGTDGADAARKEAPIPFAAAVARLKKIKSFYFFLLGIGALGFALFSVPLFLNLLLERRFGLEVWDRSLVIAFTELGSVVGALLAARYSDRLFRASPVRAVALIAVAIAGYGVFFTAGIHMPNVTALAVVVSIANGCSLLAFITINMVMAGVIPYRLRAQGFAMIGLYLFLVGGYVGLLITGSISDAFGERLAMTVVVPPAALIGAALVAYGARHVLRDLSLVVEELTEEYTETRRIAAAGGDVPVLQVRNLDVSYGQVQVLFDVEVDVREGEVLALLGTNGAGKSTLLRAVSGLTLPDRGVIRLDGHTITYADAETRVGQGIVQVPGGKAVFPTLSVAENLMAGAYRHIWRPDEVRRRVEEVLELFPRLRERLHQPAGTLSGGEQQMLAIGKGLLLEPRILLLDELSLGLAPVMVQEILEVVEQLKARGITMVIVEQSLNVALSISDRAVFMEKGQVRFQGPADELLERDDLVRAVFLGGEGG